MLAHSDGRVVAFNPSQPWSPASGSVVGQAIKMAFLGEELSGVLDVGSVPPTLVWSNGEEWRRISDVNHCSPPVAPPIPAGASVPPVSVLFMCSDYCDFSTDGECDE